jgi:hypothetical protein
MIVYDEGTQFFAANLSGNAGKTIAATQLIAGQPGATNLPAFYTLNDIVNNPLTVANFAFSTTEYKKTINQADQTFVRTIAGFDPNLRAPYTQNYTFGIQRELWKNNVLEVRYVGNQSRLAWRTSNLNEVNIFENGFLTEFKNAQRNLQLNQAANVQSFQNRNLPGQVALPIFDAAFGARRFGGDCSGVGLHVPICKTAKRARWRRRWRQIKTMSVVCSAAASARARACCRRRTWRGRIRSISSCSIRLSRGA